MTEQSQEVLDEALKMALDGLKAGKEFAVEQAPIVVQEILAWGFWRGVLIAVAGFAVAALFGTWLYKVLCPASGVDGDGYRYGRSSLEPEACVGVAALFCVSILGFLAGVGGLWDCLQVCVAPRLYVIEYLSSLVK
jgi:small-conductance mechanosensitive channel